MIRSGLISAVVRNVPATIRIGCLSCILISPGIPSSAQNAVSRAPDGIRINVGIDPPIFADGFESGDTSLWSAVGGWNAVADDRFEAVARSPLTVPAAGVLANDPGAASGPMTATLVEPPDDPDAGVAVAADGSFVYTLDRTIGSPMVDRFVYRGDGVDGGGLATVEIEVLPAPTLTDLRVFYRLDPWLIGGTYGGGIWTSPIHFGPVGQGGDRFVIEVRANALNNGAPVSTDPTWISGDPAVVTVDPAVGALATMSIRGPGATTLYVGSQGVATTLSITATAQGTSLVVEIDQP